VGLSAIRLGVYDWLRRQCMPPHMFIIAIAVIERLGAEPGQKTKIVRNEKIVLQLLRKYEDCLGAFFSLTFKIYFALLPGLKS